MKKVLSLVAVCVLLVGMMACGVFSASAATPKEEIVAAVKAALPAEDFEANKAMIENTLSQIDVTAEQAKAVIANIEAVKSQVEHIEEKHLSLSEYSAAEQKIVLSNLDKACATLGLGYEIVPVKKPTHEGDVIAKFYKLGAEKVVIAESDPDIVVKTTNVPETNTAVVVALFSAMALAGVAFVYGKKLVASR